MGQMQNPQAPSKEEFDELNDHIATLNTKINLVDTKQSVITAKNATSTNTQYDTYNGRKFSDYRLLLFILYNSSTDKSIIRSTVIVPPAYWESGKQVILTAHHGVSLNTLSGIAISYNSDTSVKAVLTGAGSLTGFEIIGWANIV